MNNKKRNVCTRCDTDVKRTWEAAPSDLPVEDPVDIIPSVNAIENPENHAGEMLVITENDVQSMIAEKCFGVRVEHANSETQFKIEKWVVKLLSLSNATASKRISTTTFHILDKVVVAMFSREVAGTIMCGNLERLT